MKLVGLDLGPHSADYREADEEDCIFSGTLHELDEFLKVIPLPDHIIEVLKDVYKIIKDEFNGEILFSSDIRNNKILSKTLRQWKGVYQDNGVTEFADFTETTFQFIFDLSDASIFSIVFKDDSINDEFINIDFPVRPSILLEKIKDSDKLISIESFESHLKTNLIKLLPSNTVYKG